MRHYRKVYIEITNVCNASCDFCPGTLRPSRYMDPKLFSLIIAQVHSIAGRLHFHVMGEPLLHPEIETFLGICSVYKPPVALTTNGILLSEKSPALLKAKSLRQICISLHSLLHQRGSDFTAEYLDSVTQFINQAAALRPDLIITLRYWDSESAQDTQWNAVASQLDVRLPGLFCDDCYNTVNDTVYPAVKLSFAARFTWPKCSDTDLGESGTCLGLRSQFAILADGTVVPCCLDSEGIIDLGNIQDTPLQEILSGTRGTAIRNGFGRGNIVEELCRKCSYRERFHAT